MSIPPLAAGVFWIALILGMTAGFFVFVRRWAARRNRDVGATASEMMSQFRSLHARGGLSDEEFATIKAKLGPELQLEAGQAVSATTMAEAATLLQQTAEAMTTDLTAAKKAADQSERVDEAVRRGESGEDEPGGGAAQDGCDEAPPNGGDSTR
ncbi:MAG: hypothetical protein AAF266_16360 [Planctomycetota bacterium]